jgi:hypothetical protein
MKIQTVKLRWSAGTIAMLVVTMSAPVGWAQLEIGPLDTRRAALLRQDLESIITEYESIIGSIPVQPEILQMLSEARLRLAEVPDRELAAIAPELESNVAKLRNAATAFRIALHSRREEASASKSAGLPSADYPSVSWSFAIDAFLDIGQIPDDAGNTSVSGICNYLTNPTPNQQYYYLNLEIASAALRDTADRLCSFVASVVAGGGNLSLVCIITDLLYMVEKSIKENWFLCGAVMGEAEIRANYYRIGHIHGDLENAKVNLANEVAATEYAISAEMGQNTALIMEVDADLAMHDHNLQMKADQVDQALENHRQALVALRRQSLRHHIEQRLSEADHGPVALFLLPEYLGGYLETVRDIVFETIGEAAASGHDVGQAEQLFASGDADLSDLRFKTAYDQFGRAYRAALK